MERRSFLRHAGLTGVLAAGAAPAVVHAQANIRWRLASSFPKSLDTIFGAAEVFAKKVGEMSGGKFQISVHAGGELMPPFGVVDGVQNGTVELAHTAPYYFFGKDETFAIGCAIPFGLNSRQMTAWMYEGNGLKLMREFYAQYNIISFPMGNTGAQMGGWYRKEIKTLADMKGLKFRIGGFAGKVVERLGSVPQNIPGGEIYQALEKGTIDAAEWVGPYDDQKLGFNKVAPFYHYPGWWEGGPQLDLYVNTKAYEGLSAEYKAIIEAAAAYAHTDMQAKYDARNPGALKQLVAAKTKVVALPKAVMDAAFKESMALYSEISSKNPNWKKVYTDYANFRREQNLWFRFTEGQFDRYMQSAKL
ncbi:MAG: TRAP transporter substrate-binding protein DctP [Pseudomonadota bacterium]